MSQIHLSKDEIVKELYTTSIWGVTGIPQFLTKNVTTLEKYLVTIIDKSLLSSNNEVVERKLKEFQIFATLEHPSIYKIEIYNRTFSPSEIQALEGLHVDPFPLEPANEDYIFPPERNRNSDMDSICIKMENPHHATVMGWIQVNHFRKHSQIFNQQQVVILQNIVQAAKYLHSKEIPTGSLIRNTLFCGENDASLNSPLIKIDLSKRSYHGPEPFSEPEDIAQLTSLFEQVLMFGNPMIENMPELIALRQHSITSMDQIKLQILNKDNKFQQLMSFLVNPEGSEWLDSLQFTTCLGSGSFGLVMSAVNEKSRDDGLHYSAVKIITGQLRNSSHDSNDIEDVDVTTYKQGQTLQLSKAKQEFENMKACQHPNLTKLYQFKERRFSPEEIKKMPNIKEDQDYHKFRQMLARVSENGATVYCIEMELCGPNLRTWLDTVNMNKQEGMDRVKLRIIRDLIQGLKYLHSKDILHRDFKPANVFLASNTEMFPVKIGDFGLSKSCSSSTEDFDKGCDNVDMNLRIEQGDHHTANVGTFLYQAPEIQSNATRTRYGKPADIYSLGLVLFEIVQPFKSKRDRYNAFRNLVYEGDTTIISDELSLVQSTNVKSLIIQMTKTDVNTRIISMPQVLLVGPEIRVENSDQLRNALELSGTIILSDGIYNGPFLLESDSVNIQGSMDTIFQMEDPSSSECVITITGQHCLISNIKIYCGLRNAGVEIVADNNKMENVIVTKAAIMEAPNTNPIQDYLDLEGQGVLIKGSRTKLSNMVVDNMECAIQIRGQGRNELSDIKIIMCSTGLELYANSNIIRNVAVDNCGSGICLNHSNQNVVENVSCRISDDIPEAIWIYGIYSAYGDGNLFRNVDCNNYSVEKEEYGVWTDMEENFGINNSSCGPVSLHGNKIRVEKVNGEELIEARGGKDMTFIGCSSKIFKCFLDLSQVTLETCTFDEIKMEVMSSDEDEDGGSGSDKEK